MAQLPSTISEWMPLPSSQFISPVASAALIIPALPTGNVAKGAQYVGIVRAQGTGGFMFIRLDGNAVTAATSGGIQMASGDYMLLYGIKILQAARLIASVVTMFAAIDYYYFRPEL